MENGTVDITLDEMITELGGTPPVPEDAPAPPADTPPAAPAVETPPAEPTPGVGTESAAAPTNTETPPAPAVEKPDKAAQTFAAMRVQNKKQSEMLKAVASLFEVDVNAASTEDSLLEALQAKVIEKQAAAQNIPASVLSELTMLRQNQQSLTAQQRNAEAAVGFQRVQDTFKLTSAQLNKFAEELIENGMNPLEQSVDLVKQYKSLHFDELVEKAKQEAVIAEQNRAAKATSQSTTPSSKQGAGSAGEPAKVSNVHELNAWFDGQTKK